MHSSRNVFESFMTLSFLNSLPLTRRDRTIIAWVFGASAGISAVFVAGVWVIQFLASSAEPTGTASPPLTLQQSKKLLPVDMRAHRAVADRYIGTNQPAKAIPHLQRILALSPTDRTARIHLATGYLAAGRYAQAAVSFKELLKDDLPDSLRAAITARRALALFHSGHIRQSAEMLDRCLQTYPDCAEAMCYRGQVEAALHAHSPATATYFRNALAAAPHYAEPRYQLARFLMNRPDAAREDYLRAREELLTLLETEPLNPKAHSRLGMIYYYLGQNDLARKSYAIALALNPEDYNTRYNLGELWYSEDRFEQALEAFQLTLRANPSHMQALFKTGLIMLDNAMYNEAIRAFQKATRLAPGNVRILFQLAVAYERKGLIGQAAGVYEEILERDALNGVARQKLRLLAKTQAEGEHHM
jgi:tetratricopeptide (TPR) repeat protein